MQNIDGLLQTMEVGEMKLAILWQLISQNQVDVFVCSELGTCWDIVNYEDHLPQKTRGTGILVTNQLAHHAQKTGDDPMGLGWWTWVKLKRQNTQITRIVSLYQPCYSDSPLFTYQQHIWGLVKLWQDECLQAAVFADLNGELQKWHDKAENL